MIRDNTSKPRAPRREPIARTPDGNPVCPFTILVDTAEGCPFTFESVFPPEGKYKTRKHPNKLPWWVETRRQSLGRFPNSLGDYSVVGLEGIAHIERKSPEDLQSTLLGWADDRRERFESELKNLSAIDHPAVVVEASLLTVIATAEPRGTRTKSTVQKQIFSSVLALQQDYPKVAWLFCDTRPFAEIATFRWFERIWNTRERLRLLAGRLSHESTATTEE